MSLIQLQLELVAQAALKIKGQDVAPYFKLRDLLRRPGGPDRAAFRKQFERFYGLNAAGLTEAFKSRYFDLLFELKLGPASVPPFEELLRELYPIVRRQGDRILAASFVSKLVAMHDESWPLYDRHVSQFFGIDVPSIGSLAFRIAGFVENLTAIRRHYFAWGEAAEFQRCVSELTRQFSAMSSCHPVRICDFLVWTVGRERIGTPPRPNKRALT